MDTIPRAYKLIAVACCIAFVLGACSPLRPESGEAIDAVTTADVQLPTVTPTTAAEIDLEEQKTKIAALLPTVTTASENTPAPIDAPAAGAERATDAAEGGMFLLPTVTPFVAQPQLEITALSVNVRRGPGTAYEIIALVEQGDRFQLVGPNEAGDWWQACCFDGENGWLSDELVTVQNADADDVVVDIPPSPEPTVTLPPPQPSPATDAAEGGMFQLPTITPFVANPQLEITALSVNVRRGPGTEFEIIDLVEQGDRFQLVGRNEAGDWWQACCFDGENGWLSDELVSVQNAEAVDVIVDIPPPPAPTAALPVPQPSPEMEATIAPEAESTIEVEETVAPEAEVIIEAQPLQQDATAAPTAVAENSGTAGDFNPDAQYQIVNYRVLGFDDNNGGIFNSGGQHHIFVTALDENGNGVDGAVVKDAVGDKLNAVVGNKGPGKAEITMYWDPYKLYVASDPTGAVTSQVSNQMNTAYPHIPDIVGMLGPADNKYAICPTVDDRCDPPFYHAHWPYEIAFQKVK